MDEERDFSELRDIFEGDPDNSLMIAEGMLGQDAIEFAKSDLGRYLIGRANIEIKDATEQLKRTFSWRRRRITQLQNEIWRAEMFKVWLLQQIQAGRTALAELDRRTQTGEI